MSNTQQLALSIQPILSYPRQAQVGKTYLMTIDLQSSSDEWPYEEEEYPIYCMLDTSQLFSCQPLGEPAVVLHRFGGSYGAAEFLLTAAQEEMEGEITVTLANGWGMPIRVLSLGQISVTQVVTDSRETTTSYKGVDSVFKGWKRNPYIVGRSVQMPDEFFGRTILLRTIGDTLQQNGRLILLRGQRRIGKSSVLKNIHHFVSPDEFVFVSCDLQVHAYSSLGQILYAIAREIFQHFELDTNIIEPLLNANLENIFRIFNWRVLPQVYEKLDAKKLILLLDDFDVVSQNDTENSVGFLGFLENLVRQERLFVIAVVGRYLNAMPNLVQLFRDAPFYEIGLLDNKDAQELITKPAAQILEYHEKTIAEIIKLSAGHPYYIQLICHAIFNQARNKNCFTIVPDYVNDAVNQGIELAEGGLASIWDMLSISEKVVISAVAEAQKSNTIENPLKVLEAYGLVLTDYLEGAIKLLIDKGFLDSYPVKIKVELVRLWLLQHHRLRYEVKNLEILEQEKVNQLLFVARSFWTKDKQQDALIIYEHALKLNPNHFSSIVELAEKYLEVENFDKALKLYKRVYKLDRIRYEEQFIEALNQYGDWLITQKKYIAAKQQYEKILQIQPENSLPQQRIAEIKAFTNQGWFNKAMALIRRIIES